MDFNDINEEEEVDDIEEDNNDIFNELLILLVL